MDPHPQPPCCRVSLAEICSLYQRLYQTPADTSSVQAAVDQVCGARIQTGFCCSSRLLDVLVEVERQRWVKEQVYWDFQLLDFNRDSSLSLSDVKILLERAQESQVTSLSWVDFLTQRQETSNRVTWSELETWLFEKSPSSRHETLEAASRTSDAKVPLRETDQLQYQRELMDESKSLKKQWDAGGLDVLVRAAEDTANGRGYHYLNQEDLTEAVEHKYAALCEKLFCDMLQAHYGAQVWASLNNGQKEQNLNEFKMLAEFGLERGSELVLSQLPGAAHNFRDEESSGSCEEATQTCTAIQGLKELQRRRELERRTVAIPSEGRSSVSHAYKYLLLFAQIIKVKMECSFRAALLVVEPYWKQRFWDGNPVLLESCFEELAHIQLTTGQRSKTKMDKKQYCLQKMSVEEDKLLSLLRRQEEARDLLFQLLQSCSHDELQEPSSNLLHNKSEENMDPLKEVPATKVVRNPLRQLFLLAMTVTKTCLQEERGVVTWGDCAVRLLVQVQLKQELELRELILELVRGFDKDGGHQKEPPVLKGQDSVSDLIQLLQPLTPKDQLNLRQFKTELVFGLEGTSLQKEQDNNEANITETHDSPGGEVDNGKQAENKTSLKYTPSTNEDMRDDENKDDVRNQNEYQEMMNIEDFHTKRQEEWADRENHQMDSSAQTKYDKRHIESTVDRDLNQWEHREKERTSVMEIPSRGSGRDTDNISPCRHIHDEQVSSNELTSSMMEDTESLIAGLMTLKAKVEQVYIRRGADGHSPQRLAGSVTEAISVIPMKRTDLHSAETQTCETEQKALKEILMERAEESLIPKEMEKCDTYKEPFNLKDGAEKAIPSKTYKEMNCVEAYNEGNEIQGQKSWKNHLDPVKEAAITKEQNDPTSRTQKSKAQSTAETCVSMDQAEVSCGDRMDRKNTLGGEVTSSIPVPSAQASAELLASTVMEAAENLIGSLKTLKEEISRATKSQLTERGEGSAVGKGCGHEEAARVKIAATRTETENKPPPSQPGKNRRGSEDSRKYDESLEDQAVQTSGERDRSEDLPLISGPVTREVSWELHPECSRGCSHAKLWESEINRGEVMAGPGCVSNEDIEVRDKNTASTASGSKKTEERTEGLSCDLQGCDEKKLPETTLREPLTQGEECTTDKGHISHTNAGIKERDCEGREKDQQVSVTSREDSESDEHSSTTQKEGVEDTTVSTLLMGDLSEDGCTEQSSTDKLAMSFLEAAQNLIGGLILGKDESGLSSVRRVVVILTDSASVNGDLILGQGEELSEVSGTISTLEGSSAGESQVLFLPKKDEARDDPNHVPVTSEKGNSWELHTDCVLSGNHANVWEECPDGEPSTKQTKAGIQLPMPDCEGTEQIICLSEGCESAVKTQCRKQPETEKENATNKSSTCRVLSTVGLDVTEDPSPDVDSDMKTVRGDNCLPHGESLDKTIIKSQREMGGEIKCVVQKGETNNKREQLAKEKMKTGGQIKKEEVNDTNSEPIPEQRSDGGNITTNIAKSDRGDPLTQTEGGINNDMMKKRDTEGTVEKQYKVSKDDEETESEGTKTDMQLNRGESTCQEDVKHNENEKAKGPEHDNYHDYNLTKEVKTVETEGGKREAQCERCPSQSSPDTLVKNVLLATQGLIGSLTSLKDSMGIDARAKRLATTNNNNIKSAEDLTNEQTFEPDIHGECSQSNATLNCERTNEPGECTPLSIIYAGNKSEGPTVQQGEDQSAKDDKQDQCAVENERHKPVAREDVQQSVLGDDDNKTISKEDRNKPPMDERDMPTFQEDAGIQRNILTQRELSECSRNHMMSETEETELSTLVPSKVGVNLNVPPTSLTFHETQHLTELHSTCTKMVTGGIVPDSQGHRNLKNKWRSVSEKQIKKLRLCDASGLESHTSERIKIQIIEKSKSVSDCYKKRLEPPPPITAVTAEPELEEAISETYPRDRDMKNGEHNRRIQEKQEKEDDLVTGNTNTEIEQKDAAAMCQDNNEPDSLNDLTVSLLEATSSLIGRLASLKGELGKSQLPDSFVTNEDIEQNVQETAAFGYDVRTTNRIPVSQMKVTELNSTKGNIDESGKVTGMSSNKANRDQLEHDGECIRTEGRSKVGEYQTMNVEWMNSEPMRETIIDEEYIDVQTQRGCETDGKQSNEKEEKNKPMCSVTGNVVIIQNDKLIQGGKCHMQEDTQTEVTACSVVGIHQADNIDPIPIQFKKEAHFFQEQINSTLQMRESIVDRESQITSSAQRLRHFEDGRDPSENNTEEYNTVYPSHQEEVCSRESASQSVSSEQNVCEMYNTKLGPERSEQLTSGKNKEVMCMDTNGRNEDGIDREIQHSVEKKKVEQSEGIEMKDLDEMQSLRNYIRKGLIKRKREDAKEREEERPRKENDKQSDQEIMERQYQDRLSGYGAITSREKGERMELNDIKIGPNQLAGSDDGLLENKESSINVKITMKYGRHEGDAMKKESREEMNMIDVERQIKKEKTEEILEEEGGLDSQPDTEQSIELCPAQEPDMAIGLNSKSHQSTSINKQAPGPWFKFWEVGNQTVTVAAVGTSLNDNFLNHMAQVPANGILVRNEAQLPCPVHNREQPHTVLRPSALQDLTHGTEVQPYAVESDVSHICSLPPGQSVLQREKVFIRLSVREQQEAIRRLKDLQREAELKCASDRRRQMLRFQERLSIARNRKSEVDLMDITQRISPQLSPEPLPEGDAERQKSAVRERLEKMKRERTYLMQTRRDRNMSSFRELLDPVLTRNKREDSGSELRGAEGM